MTRPAGTNRQGTGRRRTTQATSAVLAGWGAVLLARPELIARDLAPHRREPQAWVIRVLGARLLAQHGLLVAAPRHGLVLASATIDGIHALSMLTMAATMPRYRRVTLISAGIAGAATLAGVLAAPQARR